MGDDGDDRTLAQRGGDLLEVAVDRISPRERVLRVRRTAPRIAVVALAAMVSYFLAVHIVGNAKPFFAPVASVVVLGITLGQRTQRAIQLAVGVAVGVLVADLAIRLVGTGTWQIAVIVFCGMVVVVAAGGDQLATVQAANAGVLIATLALPGDLGSLARFADALIGAGTALVFNLVLFPVNPLKLARGAIDPAAERIAGVLDAIADALADRDDEATARALRRARALEEHTPNMRADIATSGETARLALLRRGQRDVVERYERALEQVARAQRDVAGLARSADRALRAGDPVPPTVVSGLRDLATAMRHLPDGFVDRPARELARDAALRAATAATAGLEETRNLSVSLVVGQTRMVAFDVLRATGMSLEDARSEIREAADEEELRAAPDGDGDPAT